MPYYDIGDGVQGDLPGSDHQALTYDEPTYRDYKGRCTTCNCIQPRYHAGYPRPTHCWQCLGAIFMSDLQKTYSTLPFARVTSPKPCSGGPHLAVHGNNNKRCLVCRDIAVARRRRKSQLTGLQPPSHHRVPAPTIPDAHQRALSSDRQWFLPDFRCSKCETFAVRHVKHEEWCQGCWSTKWDETFTSTPRQAAQIAGETWYTPDEACPKCDTLSERRVNDGVCSGCSGITPHGAHTDPARQAAITAGDKWYTPSEPHSKCGLIAERYVPNGRCKGCAAVGDAERALMEAGEMPLDVAIAIGAKVYTDDDGHWRLNKSYVG